jgi:DNA-binding transcriptional ArsR family regulator
MKDLWQSDYCAQKLRLLADPERLLILQALRHGPKNVSQITDATNQKIANVSHHLKVLREGGIVESKREGRYVHYHLAPNVYIPAESGSAEFLDIGCCRIEIPNEVRRRPSLKRKRS